MQLEARELSFRYGPGHWILKKVDFAVNAGERIALVGPSGCGKSTLAKLLAGYLQPDSGAVYLDGKPLPKKGFCPVQMIHQNPELAVNPRLKLRQTVTEGWNPPEELLTSMGIQPAWLNRFPAELSGGELQRFCIARVLAPSLRFLICDEITTMLDVITQAQIWQLLLKEAEERSLGLVVITHNMALAKRTCNRIVRW